MPWRGVRGSLFSDDTVIDGQWNSWQESHWREAALSALQSAVFIIDGMAGNHCDSWPIIFMKRLTLSFQGKRPGTALNCTWLWLIGKINGEWVPDTSVVLRNLFKPLSEEQEKEEGIAVWAPLLVKYLPQTLNRAMKPLQVVQNCSNEFWLAKILFTLTLQPFGCSGYIQYFVASRSFSLCSKNPRQKSERREGRKIGG